MTNPPHSERARMLDGVHIGAQTFINVNCVFLDSAEIRIGANVLVGPGVQLLTVTHPVRAADRLRTGSHVACRETCEFVRRLMRSGASAPL